VRIPDDYVVAACTEEVSIGKFTDVLGTFVVRLGQTRQAHVICGHGRPAAIQQ
jgi:hypothetical protein